MISKELLTAVHVSPRAAPFFFGVSLKMYMDHRETIAWCRVVAELASQHPAISTGTAALVVLPTFPALAYAIDAFAGTQVQIGAQNLFWEDRGAFTGEVSGAYLKQIGCRYVEIGHAERRKIFAETEEIVSAKLEAALRNSLTPILCVGEPDRVSSAEAAAICIEQLQSAIRDVEVLPGVALVAAYEPGWAIGAPQPAPVDHIVAVCTAIKKWLTEGNVGDSRVIYGGSAGPGLLGRLELSVDGLFLGRFAHDPLALVSVLDEVPMSTENVERAPRLSLAREHIQMEKRGGSRCGTRRE